MVPFVIFYGSWLKKGICLFQSRLHPGMATGPVIFDCYDYDDRLEQEAARVNWRAAPTPTQEVRKAGANEKN